MSFGQLCCIRPFCPLADPRMPTCYPAGTLPQSSWQQWGEFIAAMVGVYIFFSVPSITLNKDIECVPAPGWFCAGQLPDLFTKHMPRSQLTAIRLGGHVSVCMCCCRLRYPSSTQDAFCMASSNMRCRTCKSDLLAGQMSCVHVMRCVSVLSMISWSEIEASSGPCRSPAVKEAIARARAEEGYVPEMTKGEVELHENPAATEPVGIQPGTMEERF